MTQVIDLPWSNVHAGMKCRWATPRFVKHGVILSRKEQSVTVQFWSEERPRVIPDARWYFVQAKMYGPDHDEHFVIVDEFDDIALQREDIDAALTIPDAHDEFISVNEGCELIRMDPKQFRRLIRRGVIPAFKSKDSRWVIRRSHLMELSAKNGWI